MGGRLVYSTCCLDPVENEAVVAALLTEFRLPNKDGAPNEEGGCLRLVDVSDELPSLVRRRGLHSWRVWHKGCWYSSWEEMQAACGRSCPSYETLFPPSSDAAEAMGLHRCMRLLPQDNDSGGFFVAVIEKVCDHAPSAGKNLLRPHAAGGNAVGGNAVGGNAVGGNAVGEVDEASGAGGGGKGTGLPEAVVKAAGLDITDGTAAEMGLAKAELAKAGSKKAGSKASVERGAAEREGRDGTAGCEVGEGKPDGDMAAERARQELAGGDGAGGDSAGGEGAAAGVGVELELDVLDELDVLHAHRGATRANAAAALIALKFVPLYVPSTAQLAGLEAAFGLSDALGPSLGPSLGSSGPVPFPLHRLAARSPGGTTLVLVSDEVAALLSADSRGDLRLIGTGVRIFVKENAKGIPCEYRLCHAGLPLLLPHLTKQRVPISVPTLERLLRCMHEGIPPTVWGDPSWGVAGEATAAALRACAPGSVALECHLQEGSLAVAALFAPSGLLRAMVSKAECASLLCRLSLQ